MLKKDFLLYLHKDWVVIAERLHTELSEQGGEQPAQIERLRKADAWIAHYAEQLRTLYGLKV